MRAARRSERHLSYCSNWLRAAVLGANDGILSTSSLVLGVAASGASSSAVVTAGVAGLVAGSLAMAAGEFVSVNSQRDQNEPTCSSRSKSYATTQKGSCESSHRSTKNAAVHSN
jgi:VIT1/CCC1 family predicted Fe2+/Mn2+ transporter